MGALSPKAAQVVVGVFLDAYNRRHESAYIAKEREPAADLSCDYLGEDPDRAEAPLKLQLARAVTTVGTTHGVTSAGTDRVSRQMHAWLHDSEARQLPSVIFESAAGCAARAVRAKAERLGPSAADLVLVICYDLKRCDESVDLPEMREAVAAIANGFREVWAVWAFRDAQGRADRLWPGP